MVGTSEKVEENSSSEVYNDIDKLQDVLDKGDINIPEAITVKVKKHTDLDGSSEAIDEMNQKFNMINAIYQDVLAPELQENEKLKREHKSKLMDNIFKILKIQFTCTYIFVILFIVMVGANKFIDLEPETISEIIGFLKFYITSVVAELIAILFFIVQSVFDKSIVDLFKNFDANKKDRS